MFVNKDVVVVTIWKWPKVPPPGGGVQCLRSSAVKIVEEAHTFWGTESLLFTKVSLV